MFNSIQQKNFNQHEFKRPYYKRTLFYIGTTVLLIAGFIFYNLISFYGTIVVNNTAQAEQNQNSDKFNNDNPMPKPDPNRLTVLILGNSIGRTDGSIQDTGALLTDSMELLMVDKPMKQEVLVSIPRDLQVEMFGVNGKINESYVRGLEKNEGIPYVSQLISRITGVYVDKTIVFNLDAFKTIVDSMGGIDIHLDKPFLEPTQWTYPFSLSAGDNHLNGDQALYYVRSRFSSSDFDRSRRQQQVMFAIKSKLGSLGFIGNPLKVASLLSNIKNDIKTDFNILDINSLMSLVGSFSNFKSPIKTHVISNDNLVDESKTGIGEYILTPKGGNFDGFRNFFKDIFRVK